VVASGRLWSCLFEKYKREKRLNFNQKADFLKDKIKTRITENEENDDLF
jgi:hypothetical protein